MQSWMPIGEESQSKLTKYLQKDTPPVFVVILACLIPIMPNGVIPIMASKTDISSRDYILAILGGTAVNIIICCTVGNQILVGNWVLATVSALALFILVVILWLFREPVLNWASRLNAEAKERRQRN